MNSTIFDGVDTPREVGVDLKEGYNGHLTSREAGSVGGQMVKNKCPVRSMTFHRENRIAQGHKLTVRYIASLSIQGISKETQRPGEV